MGVPQVVEADARNPATLQYLVERSSQHIRKNNTAILAGANLGPAQRSVLTDDSSAVSEQLGGLRAKGNHPAGALRFGITDVSGVSGNGYHGPDHPEGVPLRVEVIPVQPANLRPAQSRVKCQVNREVVVGPLDVLQQLLDFITGQDAEFWP